MKKKLMVCGLLLFAVLALSIPGASIAEDARYEASNITIQLGSDEKELNFTWFTTDTSENCDLVIFREDKMEKEMRKGKFPKNADVYAGSVEAVEPITDSVIYACKVTGVKVNPNKEYAYAVGNGDTLSEIYNFKTQNPGSFNFIFVGDPQIGASHDVDGDSEGWMDCLEAALGKFEKTNFILSAGDQVETYRSGSFDESEYKGFFGKFTQDAEEGEAQQHQLLTTIPFAPTIGNHDTNPLHAYHFSVPNESDLGYTTGGGDYWFTYDNTLFMVLNTNTSSFTCHDEFMAEAIEANPRALWKVVVFHHSLYSSASHITDVNNIRLGMAPLMDLYDIDVVLAGHDHFYARTHQLVGGEEGEVCYESTGRDGSVQTTCVELTDEVVPEELLTYDKNGSVVDPIGTVYFTANSASGSKFYNFNEIEGYTNIYLAAYDETKTQSYLNVEVKGANLTVSAYSVETGEMIDTYSILKTHDVKRRGHHQVCHR